MSNEVRTIDWIDGEMCQKMDTAILKEMFGKDLEWDEIQNIKSYSCGQKLEVNYKNGETHAYTNSFGTYSRKE
ncbi:hypothetical protein OR62_07980 [Clostridium tetani]|uniref:Uncharacterized protein n=1 Tax=Clostridium tetani TaxID=1513 RepID=A0A4Q0VED4_CLOTA|nr:hypothetical protein [Clostridium tetani]KHO39066.1 hypothetical protein OR62_07980 [Clostridium tetani]RXI38088.1 hypothetical protein DP129_12105 [Clostridium tetani]RXI49363.1 hypothetical protein DP130_04735 [Clostridium tetani]RXI52356.1 hypothetical protein DP131_12520 [Clostridium tetani]RXI69995.1 hypothetical protein DQN76_07210 [Clostridium tetani]